MHSPRGHRPLCVVVSLAGAVEDVPELLWRAGGLKPLLSPARRWDAGGQGRNRGGLGAQLKLSLVPCPLGSVNEIESWRWSQCPDGSGGEYCPHVSEQVFVFTTGS